MKKQYYAAVLLSLMLAGCSGSQSPKTVMPQNATSDITAEQTVSAAAGTETQEVAAGAENVSSAGTSGAVQTAETLAASGSVEELLSKLYSLKAEAEALDVEGDILEADLRTGKVTREEFNQRDMELENREDTLDLEEDQVKYQLRSLGWQERQLLTEEFTSSLASMDMKQLLNVLNENDMEDNRMELDEDLLANRYLNGEITREEYIAGQAEYERAKDILDAKEDEIEFYLKRLGWDD